MIKLVYRIGSKIGFILFLSILASISGGSSSYAAETNFQQKFNQTVEGETNRLQVLKDAALAIITTKGVEGGIEHIRSEHTGTGEGVEWRPKTSGRSENASAFYVADGNALTKEEKAALKKMITEVVEKAAENTAGMSRGYTLNKEGILKFRAELKPTDYPEFSHHKHPGNRVNGSIGLDGRTGPTNQVMVVFNVADFINSMSGAHDKNLEGKGSFLKAYPNVQR